MGKESFKAGRPAGSFDVVIIGSGITGLSAAYHLKKLGATGLAIAADAAQPAASAQTAGFISGGQLDNFTRVAHSHGVDTAVALWRFGDRSFAALVDYCKEHGVPHRSKRRLRLIMSDHELKEAEQATSTMVEAGLSAALHPVTPGGDGLTDLPGVPQVAFTALGPTVLAVQDDGAHGGWVDTAALLASLERETKDLPRLPAVNSLTSKDGSVQGQCGGGQVFTSEMVVLAAHLGIGALVPELASALVSIADQWTACRAPDPVATAVSAWDGIAFTANNTYEWGVFPGDGKLNLGGGRYLRPGAGIEATHASTEPRITAHLKTWAEKVFPPVGDLQVGATQGLLDINPCDELPIVGPMYGNGRLLVATGFLNAGLTEGFYSGRCLAELILKGSSANLPRRLWPERLRSLES